MDEEKTLIVDFGVRLIFGELPKIFVLFIVGFVPVSYTHLDVYKRQGEEWMEDKFIKDGKKVTDKTEEQKSVELVVSIFYLRI